MGSKRQREQKKNARAASVQVFQKRRIESSSLSYSARLKINDDKPSTADTTDTEHESGMLFWNESADEISPDSEEGGHSDVDESDIELEQFRTKRAASPEICLVEIK